MELPNLEVRESGGVAESGRCLRRIYYHHPLFHLSTIAAGLLTSTVLLDSRLYPGGLRVGILVVTKFDVTDFFVL
jgi:hypothetical protein